MAAPTRLPKSQGDAEENLYLALAAAAKLAYHDIEIEEAGGRWGKPLTLIQKHNAETARVFLDELRAAYSASVLPQR